MLVGPCHSQQTSPEEDLEKGRRRCVIGSIKVSWMGNVFRKSSLSGEFASQVNFRVGQLLAMNPDSPLGISEI
jgi:hypothetical protein